MQNKINFIFIFLALTFTSVFSQQADSSLKTETRKKNSHPDSVKTRNRSHSPNAAMLLSVCVPGLGQAYNKKYWKIPLVYASMGTTIYFFSYNDKLYREYRLAYLNKTDTATSTIDTYPDYTKDQLHELETYHQKYRDLNVILTALFYTINVVDAYVDAHLMNFDVSDDLSFHIAPALNLQAIRKRPSAGLTLTMTF